MNGIDEMTQWCEDARSLMGKARPWNTERRAMKAATAKVDEVLRTLARLGGMSDLRTAYETEYAALAERARQLARTPPADPAQRDAELRALSRSLASLSLRIETALPMAEAEHKWRKLLARCCSDRDILHSRSPVHAEPLTALIDAARALAAGATGTDAIERAIAHLERFPKALRQAEKDQAADFDRQKQQRKAMAASLEKLEAATRLLADLEATAVGVERHKDVLRQGLADARRKQGDGDWLGASAVLDALPGRETCEMESRHALASVQAAFPDVNKGRNALAQLRKWVSEDLARPRIEQLQRAIEGVARSAPPPGAGADLSTAVADILKDVATAESDVEALRKDIAALQAQLPDLQAAAPPLLVEQLREMPQRIETLIAQKSLAIAKVQAADARARFDRELASRVAHKAAWDAVRDQTADMAKRLRLQADDAEAPPDLREAARMQVESLAHEAESTEARDWLALVAMHDGAARTLAAFEDAKQRFIDFAATRQAGDAEVRSAIDTANTRLAQLVQRLGAEGLQAGPCVDPLQASVDGIVEAWRRKLAVARADGELDLGSTLAALAEVERKALEAATPRQLRSTRDTQEDDAAHKRFDDRRARLAQSFDVLDAMDPRRAQGERARIDALAADAGLSWSERLASLKPIATGVEAAARDADEKCRALVRQMSERTQALGASLLMKKALMARGTGASFGPMFEALGAELADLELLSRTPNLETAQAHASALADLAGRLDRIVLPGTDPHDPLDDVVARMETLTRKLAAIEGELESQVPGTLAALKTRLAKLKQSMYAMDIADTSDEIDQLDQAMETAIGEAARRRGVRTAVDQLVDALKDTLDILKKDGRAPAYHDRLHKDFTAARKLAGKPDTLNGARQKLDSLLKEAHDAVLHPSQALAAQAKLLAEEQRRSLLKKEWEGRLEVFHASVMPRARAALRAPGSDPTQMGEIKRMVDVAEEAAASRDHAEALRRLRLAERRVEEIVADPVGPGIGSRRALPRNAIDYDDAVARMAKALAAFAQQVADKAPDLPPVARERIERAAGAMQSLFATGAFHADAALLNDSRSAAGARRQTREQSLQKVRGLHGLLDGHPVLAMLLANPFSTDLPDAARLLRQRLAILEANVRRCVH